jgi:hypothetical protein
MSDSATTASNGDGRDAAGRFLQGNKYSRGSPIAKKMHAFRNALLEATDPETIQRVIRKMGELGAEGDTVAAKIFLEFTCGKPTQHVELIGVDGSSQGVSIGQLQAVILSAFSDDPSARVKIARALLSLTNQVAQAEPTGEES